jgi:hypothetical protein
MELQINPNKEFFMKKVLLMSLVLLAIVGTSAVFAQQPTLDKLNFVAGGSGATAYYRVEPQNKAISGAVVIPGTYNGKSTWVANFTNCTQITSVTLLDGAISILSGSFDVGAFQGCTGLTSVTLPASMTSIGANSFRDCDNLTSVTFLGNTIANFSNYGIPGDLVTKYRAGGAGTYTRPAGSNTWTKQGGFTLNGTWKRSDGMEITISGDGTQTFTITGNAPNNGGRFNRNFAER